MEEVNEEDEEDNDVNYNECIYSRFDFGSCY